jgi:uncharacterized protein with HEPN domain
MPADVADAKTLAHLVEACRKIEIFIDGMSESDLGENSLLESSVCWQLVILGKATRLVSLLLQGRNPQIPWASIRGMRNRLVHNFDRIDLTEVWRAASRDVPVLLRQLGAVQEQMNSER